MLNVPFYANDGVRCMQASMQSMLKYYTGKEYSLDELDEATGRKDDIWTWTPQVIYALHNLGLDVKYFSKTSMKEAMLGEPWIRDTFKDEADNILKHTNLEFLVNSITALLDSGLVDNEIPPFTYIEQQLDNNHLPLILIDRGILDDMDGYHGHFVIMTGHDAAKTYFHHSGPDNPEPHRVTPRQKFIDAWNSPGTDNDLIIARGLR